MVDNAVLLLATGFGLGEMPWAPGTFGSLWGLPLAWWLLATSHRTMLGVTAALLILAVPLCDMASLALGGGDQPKIVLDEYVAFPLVLFRMPLARTPWVMAFAFALYRLFDITKPPPIELTEIGGGLGIVMDDVVAALYAWLVLSILLALWRRYRATP